MKKKMTMQDIANMTGVSRMTVSRYFSGGYISEENKKKIKRVIDEHEYTPNVYAQSLKKKLEVIGVILPTIVSRSSTKLLKGIIDEAIRHDYDYMITTAEYSEQKEIDAFNGFKNLNVTGVISLTANHHIYLDRQKDNGDMKVVLLSEQSLELPTIIYPDRDAAIEIAEEMIIPYKDKIKRICLLGEDIHFNNRLKFIKEEVSSRVPDIPFYDIYAPHNVDGLIETIPEAGTFYICVTDRIAYNLYETIKQTELKIGKDVYVIGYGDYSTSRLQDPPLTSVRLPYYEAGVAATCKLLSEEDDGSDEYMNYSIEKRASTPQ